MGPVARPAPCPLPRAPPPSLRARLGSSGARTPRLGIFQAAEVQRAELEPRPALQGPSARPGMGPGPGRDLSSGRGRMEPS